MTERPTHRLLIDEPPLQVLPSLAVAIGLNEAIFLQQLHYWLQRSQHERDGRLWVYNTAEEWRRQMPFWSVPTLRRIVGKLEDVGLILTSQEYNRYATDRTTWYTIDYARLDALARPAATDESAASK